MSGVTKFAIGFTLFYIVTCIVAYIRCRRDERSQPEIRDAEYAAIVAEDTWGNL